MEDENILGVDPFVDLSIEDREDRLVILADRMKSHEGRGMTNFAIQDIQRAIPGLTQDQYQEAVAWGNTYNRGRYKESEELNSKFENLFPELKDVQFPEYENNNGSIDVKNPELNQENAQGKWEGIQAAIDKGTEMYNNQDTDGVIEQPSLLPEGTDELVKKNLIQYGQVLRHTDPEFNKKYTPGEDPFAEPESAYEFTKQARNFQGTKFKVNALRYIAQNYDTNLYNYIDRNEDFFKIMPELRDDEEFMKMYKHHEDVASAYHDHINNNYKELYDNEMRDIMQTMRLSGAGMPGDYMGTSVAVGLGAIVESVGNLAGGIFELGGKYGPKLIGGKTGLALDVALDAFAATKMTDEQRESLDDISGAYEQKVGEMADNISHFFSSDNWKDTSIGQFAYVPDQVASASLSENPVYILPMTLKTVGEMAPAIVGAAYTGGGTLVAGGIMGGDQFFKAYHQTNKEARELGVDEEDAEAMALSIGLVTGATSALFNNPLARKGAAAMMGIRSNSVKKAVDVLANTGSRQAAVKAGTKAYAREIVGENFEEIIQGSFENYTKYKYDTKSPNPVYGVDRLMSKDEFINTMILTTTATSLMASPGLGVSSTQLEKEAWTTAGLDYKTFESAVQKELKRKNPKFTEEIAQGMLDKAKKYEAIVLPMQEAGTKINQIVEEANVVYNAMNAPRAEDAESTVEETVEEKKTEIKNGIPKLGAIVDGSKVVSVIENIGDSKTDKELSDKFGNIEGRTFKMKRVDLETLYQTNENFKNFVDENPDMEYEGSRKNAPAVIDENGNVLDGMKRMVAAYNRGQKGIRVLTEQETVISKEKQSEADSLIDEIISPPKPTTGQEVDPETGDVVTDIEKLGNHFQRVFKGSEVTYDQQTFNDVARSANLDPKKLKGFRDRKTNKIYINPELATLDTPIHEFAHIWEDMLAEVNPKAHKKALKLIEGTKFHKDAVASGYGDRSLNEALVQAIGEKGAKIFKDPKRQSEFEKIIEQVKDMIKKALSLPAEADFDIKTSSLNEMIESSAEKLMTATSIDPTTDNEIDVDAIDMQRYGRPEREAISDFKALQEVFKNDPTLAELKPLMSSDGQYVFQKQKSGKLKVKLSGQSYALVNGLNQYYDGSMEQKIDAIGDKIVQEYNANQDVPEVVKGLGWYKDLHTKMRNIFGGRTNFFGRLLGATSGQTNVEQNYKYAIQALEAYSKGAYDSYLDEYKDFIDRVEQYQNEEELNQFFNEYKGRAVNALKEQGKTAYGESRLKPDPKDINETKRKLLNLWPKANPLYRTDNPSKLYGINSPAVAKVLAGIWLEQTQQTKTNNFYENVVGITTNPTIDLWAARTIRRMIYDGNVDRYRIAERAEQGVDERVYAEQAGGLSDYQLAEEVIKNASNKLNMDPDDLQAYLWFAEKDLWLKNGWSKGTAAKKSDFREEANKNDITRYYLGLSTERDEYTDTVLESKDNLEILEEERSSINNDLIEGDLVSLKVNTTQGQYLIYPERSFDAEMIVETGQDMRPVLKRVVESAKKHEQESVFMSEVLPIDERMDPETMERELAKRPNARPAVELQFREPITFDQASEFAKENLDKEDVQLGPVKTSISGYTFITNEQGDKVIGVKYQFVPEFVFENEEDITDDNVRQASIDWVNNVTETQINLENNENVLYFYKHYVDTFVAHNNQYNGILTEIENGSEDIFKGTIKTRTKQYYQSKGRRFESEEGPSIDAQKQQDEGPRPRFTGTVPSDDVGSISGVEHRRIDTQKLPSALSDLLGKLKDKGFTSAELIYGIKSYSLKVNGKELTTEQARVVLSKYMRDNGFRQRGFETGSIEKGQDQDEATKEVYDWVNNNPNYYKTMDTKQTMELVIDEINKQPGGFENEQVIKDLIQGGTTISELARVQLARQAALRHYGFKLSKLRSEGASDAEIESLIDTMGKIERILAKEATEAGQAGSALKSWTAQSPKSIIDRLEIAMEKHNESFDNPDMFEALLRRIRKGIFKKEGGVLTRRLERTTLTKEEKAKIESFHNTLRRAPENTELANATMRSFYKYLDGIVPSYTWKDTFFGLQYAALLSGISTQVLNVTSGSSNIILQPLMDMSRVDRIFTGGYLRFINKVGVGTNLKGLDQGRKLALDILNNGSRVDKYQGQDPDAGKYNVLETKKFKELNIPGITRKGKPVDFNPYNYYKFVGRVLNATDRFIAKVGFEGRYYNYLVDQLAKDGVPKREIKQKASDLYLATKVGRDAKKELEEVLAELKTLDPNTNFDNIKDVAMRELMFKALAKRYSQDFVNKSDAEMQAMKDKDNFDGTMEEYKDYLMSLKEAELNGITADAELASNAQVFIDNRPGKWYNPISLVANYIRTLSNDPNSGFLGQLALKSFVPFTSIIGSIGEYMIDITPGVGMYRAYKAPEGLGPIGSRMREEQLSRAYFGTMSFLTLAALAAYAYEDDEDDPFFQVTGGGFNNPNQYTRNEMKNAPVPPYSIKIGNFIMDYRNIIPLSIPLSIIGNYFETFKATGGKGEVFDDMVSRISITVKNFPQLIMDSSVMTSVKELTEALFGAIEEKGATYDPNVAGKSSVEKWRDRNVKNIIRSVGGTVMRPAPQNLNLVRQVTKFFDPTSYSAGDIRNSFLYAAGLSRVLDGQPRIDAFGEKAKSYPGETVIPYTHWFNIRGNDPRWQFIDKYNAYPGKIQNRGMKIGNQFRELEPDELYQHQLTTGQEFSKMLEKYIKTAGEDRIITTSGRSESKHKRNIQKMWRAAQSKSKIKNMKTWKSNNE